MGCSAAVAIIIHLTAGPHLLFFTRERLKEHPFHRSRSSQYEEAQQLNGCDDNER